MPLYTYQCDTCGRRQDQFARMAERETSGPDCCGAQSRQVITATMVMVPGGTNPCFECPITGEPVQSMRRRKYLMEKHNVVDARDYKEQWARKDAQKKREKAEAKAYYDSLPKAAHEAAAQAAPTT